MRLQVEAARFDLELARTRLDFDRDTAALSAIVGLSEPLTGERLVEPITIEAPGGGARELAQAVVSRRPQILAARARVERAHRALELEQARRLPDVSLVAGYKRTGGDDTVVAGFMVPLPVFDQNFGNIERARAEEQATLLELDALTAQLRAETVALMTAAQELSGYALRAQEQILEPAVVARNAARAAFRDGAGNLLQLVDAERAYAEAHRDVLTLKMDAYEKAFAAQLLVLGEDLQ